MQNGFDVVMDLRSLLLIIAHEFLLPHVDRPRCLRLLLSPRFFDIGQR